ncbi:MAG TPA: hypothetical protein VNO21_17630 [Polyangiaceae bacterium]|nr:hypothetical protein [Polyangiaceae bacterium]
MCGDEFTAHDAHEPRRIPGRLQEKITTLGLPFEQTQYFLSYGLPNFGLDDVPDEDEAVSMEPVLEIERGLRVEEVVEVLRNGSFNIHEYTCLPRLWRAHTRRALW